MEHLAKRIFALDVDFRFLLCKKSGSLLISEPLPNSEGKGLGPPASRGIVRKLPNDRCELYEMLPGICAWLAKGRTPRSHRLNVDGEERCRRARPPLTKVSQGEPGVSLTQYGGGEAGFPENLFLKNQPPPIESSTTP